ncbi:heparan-alpha-glucosaminide N-acetyltransferase domain-containing protein [bacterium]|nr:heparan-alpha-glucosaminide N-acetyltransferase domain-containing protein [bacterium]
MATLEPRFQRYHEIDLLKGLACYLMLVGHAMRALPAGLPSLSAFDKIVLYIMDFSGPMFFVASGMNVLTFVDRNRGKPGFSMTPFYLASAAVLFFLGYTYNFSVMSILFGVPDIFQGVAICTAVLFLVARFSPPAWVYLVLAGVAYAIYWPVRMNLEPTREAILAMPLWERQLFAHFSLFPWIVFFLIGAALYRTRTREGEIAIGALFVAMIAGSFLLPQAFFGDMFQLMLRGVPGYVLQTGAASGLIFLVMRHLYRGAGKNRLLGALEFAGLESLLFLILHFFLIVMSLFLLPKSGMYTRAVIIVAATAVTLPLFARLRERFSKRASFVGGAMAVLLVTFVFGVVLSGRAFPVSRLFAFASAFAFAFVFPDLRAKLRARWTHIVPPKDAPASGRTSS